MKGLPTAVRRATLPTVTLLAVSSSTYDDDPVKAQLILARDKFNQKLKVLPLRWFYGGKDPTNNPFLETAYEPAKP